MQPIVALVADTREFDSHVWHCAPTQYLRAALDISGVLPLIVPAFGDDVDIDSLLGRVDGVLISGSKTNVHPSRYGVEPTAKHEPFDPARDATSLPLIAAAVAKGVPLFAICRGIQEMNVALGGSLATEIQETDGRMDHREPKSTDKDVRFQLTHPIQPKGCIAAIIGDAPVQVNSLHRQAISTLAPRLQAEAFAPDGTVEAVSVIDAAGFAIGVQWHPEYWAHNDAPSRQLFEAFGDAVRAYANRAA